MRTIEIIPEIDNRKALKILRQIPYRNSGLARHNNKAIDSIILKAQFNLYADRDDTRFDDRYEMGVQSWSPYLFSKKNNTDIRMTSFYFSQPIGSNGGFAGSLLTGKRPGKLMVRFSNFLDEKKAWDYMIKNFLPSLIGSGYNWVPINGESILEVEAQKYDNREVGDFEHRKILQVKPDDVKAHVGKVFDATIIDDKVYKSICDIVS